MRSLILAALACGIRLTHGQGVTNATLAVWNFEAQNLLPSSGAATLTIVHTAGAPGTYVAGYTGSWALYTQQWTANPNGLCACVTGGTVGFYGVTCSAYAKKSGFAGPPSSMSWKYTVSATGCSDAAAVAVGTATTLTASTTWYGASTGTIPATADNAPNFCCTLVGTGASSATTGLYVDNINITARVMSPSMTASPTASSTSTLSPGATPTGTGTVTKSSSGTATPSRTATPSQTGTPSTTGTPSSTPSNTASRTNTPSNTITPSGTASNTRSPTNTASSSGTPSNTPSNSPFPITSAVLAGWDFESGTMASNFGNGTLTVIQAGSTPTVGTGGVVGNGLSMVNWMVTPNGVCACPVLGSTGFFGLTCVTSIKRATGGAGTMGRWSYTASPLGCSDPAPIALGTSTAVNSAYGTLSSGTVPAGGDNQPFFCCILSSTGAPSATLAITVDNLNITGTVVSPSSTPSQTPSGGSSETSTPTPSVTGTTSRTATVSATRSRSGTPSATVTATVTPTASITPSNTASNSGTPSMTPSNSGAPVTNAVLAGWDFESGTMASNFGNGTLTVIQAGSTPTVGTGGVVGNGLSMVNWMVTPNGVCACPVLGSTGYFGLTCVTSIKRATGGAGTMGRWSYTASPLGCSDPAPIALGTSTAVNSAYGTLSSGTVPAGGDNQPFFCCILSSTGAPSATLAITVDNLNITGTVVSPSSTPSQTPSGGASLSSTPTPSTSPTGTRSGTLTPTGTATNTRSSTPSGTPSRSGTPTGSMSAGSSASPTPSRINTCLGGQFGDAVRGCQPCPAGYYCPAGTVDPRVAPGSKCGRGNYCPEGSSAPLPCPAIVIGATTGPAFFVETAVCLNHCTVPADGLSRC